MIKHYVESYNKLIMEHMSGEYATLLNADDIAFLTQILLDLQIGDKYDVQVNQFLVETNQMQSGLHIILAKARTSHDQFEAIRVRVKSEVLDGAIEKFKAKGVNKPTADQYNQYAHTHDVYQNAFENARTMKTFVQFLEETRTILTSRERLLQEVSTNLRMIQK